MAEELNVDESGPVLDYQGAAELFGAASAYRFAEDDAKLLLWLHAEAVWERHQANLEIERVDGAWREVVEQWERGHQDDVLPYTGKLEAEVERLHSWAGLMELLDEHYPASIFAGDGSDESADPGARIVALVREVDRLRREVEFEANGATTFSGADAVAERGINGVAFAVEDFGLDVDTDAGGIYVSLNHRPAARTETWGDDVNVDYDADGIPTGVEILRRPGSGSVFSEGGTP